MSAERFPAPATNLPRPTRLVLGAVVCAVCLVSASSAEAFVRSQTCGPTSKFQCRPGEEPKPVYWNRSCVVMHLHESGTSAIPFDEVERVARLSLHIWDRVECSYMTPIFGGLTNEDRVGYNPFTSDNANVLVFRDDVWPRSPGILALTSVTFERQTGLIVDADIEFNTADFRYTSTTFSDATVIDLQNTMVHEMGHVLGLDHTPIEDATMFASAPQGETKKRSLHGDDEAGLCEAYPIDERSETLVCQRHAIGYFPKPSLAIDEAPPETCGVVSGVRSGHGPTRGGVSVLAAVLIATLWRRKRREAASS